MRPLAVAIMLTALLTGVAPADVVTLEDGSKREGEIVKEDKDQVVLEIAQGSLKAQIILKRSEIKSIEKGKTANQKLLEEVARRKKRLKPKDASGWLEFAQWLDRQAGFSKEAREAFEKVISIDKDNETARRRLGYQKVGGQWLTEEEIMLAKGYVRKGGRWVSPEEKKKTDEKKLENVKIALAKEAKSATEKQADADAKARQEWLKAMQQLAAEKAVQYQQASTYAGVASGGVVLGPYGYGYYGVRTATGEYIPFVPASGRVVYYTTGSTLGCQPYVVSSSRRRYVSSGVNWGVRYHDKHWDVGLGSRGTVVRYTKNK